MDEKSVEKTAEVGAKAPASRSFDFTAWRAKAGIRRRTIRNSSYGVVRDDKDPRRYYSLYRGSGYKSTYR